MLSAIIVAGGSSRRMGFDKTFALIAGQPVIAHSLAAFEAAPSVSEIVLVARQERLEELREVGRAFKKVRQVCAGGVHRQDSVANGLQRLGAEVQFVAVHDAARALITPAQIERVFAEARRTGGAALAAPVRDTLKQADAERLVSGSISREGLYAMETPQIFRRDWLTRAYAEVAARQLSITDEVSALELLGHQVVLVPNESLNFKLTFPEDLSLAEFVLRERKF